MIRYDLFYLMAALLASPVVAARLARGKWRTDWRGRFGHVGVLDAPASSTDEAPGSVGSPDPAAAALEATPTASDAVPAAADAIPAAVAIPAADAIPAAVDTPARPLPPTVLVHGVSVGEVAATRQLVDLLAVRARVVVSSTTDTGVARARSLYGAHHPVVRYPLDLSWMVRRFLDAVRPDLVVLTELEVWPNLVTECTRRGIPVCVVNGRLSAASYRGYRRARGWVRPIFRQLAAVDAQNEAYARRFADLGVPRDRVRVTDTMKWDTSGRPLPGRLAAEAPATDPAAATLPATKAPATDPAATPPATKGPRRPRRDPSGGRGARGRPRPRPVPASHRRRLDRPWRREGADRHPSPRRPAPPGAPKAGAVRRRRRSPPGYPPAERPPKRPGERGRPALLPPCHRPGPASRRPRG